MAGVRLGRAFSRPEVRSYPQRFPLSKGLGRDLAFLCDYLVDC